MGRSWVLTMGTGRGEVIGAHDGEIMNAGDGCWQLGGNGETTPSAASSFAQHQGTPRMEQPLPPQQSDPGSPPPSPPSFWSSNNSPHSLNKHLNPPGLRKHSFICWCLPLPAGFEPAPPPLGSLLGCPGLFHSNFDSILLNLEQKSKRRQLDRQLGSSSLHKRSCRDLPSPPRNALAGRVVPCLSPDRFPARLGRVLPATAVIYMPGVLSR